MVGSWKAKVYDMLPRYGRCKVKEGSRCNDRRGAFCSREFALLAMGNADDIGDAEDRVAFDGQENGVVSGYEYVETNGVTKEKKSWFGWNKKGERMERKTLDDSKILKKFSKLARNVKLKTVDYRGHCPSCSRRILSPLYGQEDQILKS
ncbi:hypothetical protein IFM89_023897 [Coptis chinensis]|uniref:Uncharacterized protein n=1 Tax=Coptis chinensis TaxID=261450 RepID=A0A835I4T5_9MAGN|nr:hypothetical protein IFM89_023897 [Coptis chinensis]